MLFRSLAGLTLADGQQMGAGRQLAPDQGEPLGQGSVLGGQGLVSHGIGGVWALGDGTVSGGGSFRRKSLAMKDFVVEDSVFKSLSLRSLPIKDCADEESC